MTTSGTNNFDPSIGNAVIYAYGLVGIRRTAIAQEHLEDARIAANIMLSDWNNDTPNLWKVDLVEVPLIQGQAQYSVDPICIMILDAYLRQYDQNGNPTDTIISPLSRTEYASLPNKEMQGRVTSFWFDRLLSPSITLWQVPDGNGPYFIRYYRVTNIFDANLQSGETLDLPNGWYGAFAFGLAARLAYTYAPQKVPLLEPKAEKLRMDAMEQNTENVNLFIGPTVGSYFVR